MKKAIGMKCSKEEFENIKGKLIGCTFNDYDFNLREWPYLVNDYNKQFNNIGTSNKNLSPVTREIYETWNEEIFLNACGIEVKNKYEISEEQILILAKNNAIEYNLRQWFPEVFRPTMTKQEAEEKLNCKIV